jgi:DNA-directed RNA polymerase specialized sigma subunit
MTREDLKNYKYNQEWIKGRLDYIEEYKSNITKITTTLSDMPKGSRKAEDSIAEKLAILLDNINEIMQKIIIESEKQKLILEQLDKVEQPYKLILEKVYIQGKNLVTTASELKYSYVHICREHGVALNKFDNVI